ncbi:hypothetical protein ACKLNO_04175 [Neisseriaceae bacterium B1]
MQDNQFIDKFQAMQLAAMLINAQENALQDDELAERMLNLAETIRKKDRDRVQARLGNTHFGGVGQ